MSTQRLTAQERENLALPGVSLSRITPIPTQPQFISRLHLVEWLEGPAPRAVVVMAPAGYGKTALAAQWAARHSDKVAWYTVSREDSSRDAIFNFVACIRRVRPQFAPWIDEITGTEFDRKEVTVRLCNEIGTWDEDFLFVYDDIDELPDDHQMILQAWTDNAPLNSKTLTLRSTLPQISYMRPVSMDTIRFITSADLAFKQEEVNVLIAQHGFDPNNPEVQKIVAIADGWPAGVQMVLNSLTTEGILEVSTARIATDLRHRNIIKAALSVLTQEERTFLERMAFFESFDLPLVHEFLQQPEVENILRTLSQENIYIVQIGDNPSRYSLNAIIRSYLVENLREDQEHFATVVSPAAEYYLVHGDILKGLLLLDLIDNSERVLEIASTNLLEIMFTADRQLFYRCMESLEIHMKLDEAASCYLRAAFEAITGNRDAAAVYKLKLQEIMEQNYQGPIGAPEMTLLESRLSLLNGDFTSVIEHAQRILELPEQDRTSSVAHVITIYRAAAIAGFLMEDQEIMASMLAASLAAPGRMPDLVSRVSIPAMKALVQLGGGQLKDAIENSLLALSHAERMNISGMFFPFEAVYCLADAYREYGDIERAEALITKYLPVALEHNQTHWIVALYSKLSLIAVGRGDVSTSLSHIRVAREYVAGANFGSDISRVIDEHELLVRVALIDNERIGELLYRMPKTLTTHSFIVSYQAQREPSKAQALLNSFPHCSVREQLIKELISAQIYGDNPTKVRQHLESAVNIAMNNGFKAIFLLQSARTQNYLLEIATKQPTVYMEQLAMMIRQRMNMGMRTSTAGGLSLTKRELDILRRLDTGLPIVQIASSLHISQNTIKTHLKNLYRKMGVESREQAVTRGRELSLL